MTAGFNVDIEVHTRVSDDTFDRQEFLVNMTFRPLPNSGDLLYIRHKGIVHQYEVLYRVFDEHGECHSLHVKNCISV